MALLPIGCGNRREGSMVRPVRQSAGNGRAVRGVVSTVGAQRRGLDSNVEMTQYAESMWGRQPEPSMRRKRVALLTVEADVQREEASRRADSIQTKASLLILAATFLAGLTFLAPATGHRMQLLLTVCLSTRAISALGAVILSVIALWPISLNVVDTRKLKRKWVDSDASDYALEMALLETKVVVWEELSRGSKSRVFALKWGFIFAAVAFTATLVGTTFSAWN